MKDKEKKAGVSFFDIYDPKRLVWVRHLTGPDAGFERTVKEPIAKIWEKRGQVKILGPAEIARLSPEILEKYKPKPKKKEQEVSDGDFQ